MSLLKSGAVGDHPYQLQFADFLQDIMRDDVAYSRAKSNAAMHTHQVIFAADLSAQLGRPVAMATLSDFLGIDVDVGKLRARL